MVWRGMLSGLKTRIVLVHGNLKAQGYINQSLEPEEEPFIQRQLHQVTLERDNAQLHSARATQQFLQRNYYNVLLWPANHLIVLSSTAATRKLSKLSDRFYQSQRVPVGPYGIIRPVRHNGYPPRLIEALGLGLGF